MTHDERTMTRVAARVGAALLPVVVAVAGLTRGLDGAATALGALALVVGNFWITGRALHRAAPHGPAAVQAVALGGFVVKLVVLAVAIVLLRDVAVVDGPVLAVTTVGATVVLLTVEVRLVLRRAGFWWVHPTGQRPAAAQPLNRKGSA